METIRARTPVRLSSCILATLGVLIPIAAYAALTADTGFDGDGFATLDPTANLDTAHAVAVQSDNKVVLTGLARVGTSGSFKDYVLLARLGTDGLPDNSFGTAGVVTTLPAAASDFGGADGRAVAIQDDGGIVVAGYFNPNDGSGHKLMVLRYTDAGVLDTSFDGDGIKIFAPLDPDGSLQYTYRTEAVAIDANGKILVAGNSTRPGLPYTYPGFVVRLTSSGGVDDTFASTGIFEQAGPSASVQVNFEALRVLGDGSILVAGGTSGVGDAVLVKLDGNGALVPGFGAGGIVLLDGGDGLNDAIYDLATATGDGAILAAGQANGTAAIARFLSDGTFDAAYVAAESGPFYSIVGFADGSAVVAGLGIAARQVVQTGPDAYATADLAGASLQAINGLAVDGNGKVVGVGEKQVSGANYSVIVERMNVTAIGGGPDTTPDQFQFVDQAGVARNTQITSAPIIVGGIDAAAAISVTGGTYSIGAGAFTANPGTVTNGASVRVRHTSSAEYATATNTTLTIGGVADTFTTTTENAPNPDPVPNAFTFTDATGADPEQVVESNTITVGGINTATEISVSGGEFRIDSGAYGSSATTIGNGQTVQLRATAGFDFGAVVNVVLNIGGVTDTFTVTTRNATEDTVLDANGQSTNVTTSTGQLMDLHTVPAPSFVPAGYTFNNGFFTFSIDNMTVGGTATVTLTLPAGSAPTAYVKCDSTSCAVFAGASIAGNVVTLTLVDGGAGDSDGIANGQIMDPGAPASVYTPPSGGGGGGGGALDWLTLGPGLLLGLARRRHRGIVLALACAALSPTAYAKDDIKRVQPAPATVTAPDLGAIGGVQSLLFKNDRLYVGTTAGFAVIGADGKVTLSVPLPAMSARGLDADGDQVAYSGYVIKGYEKGTGLTAALMWGNPSDKLSVDSAEVGLVGADGKLLWSAKVAEPSALSPPALGKDAIAVQASQTVNLYNRADGAAAPPLKIYKDWLGISKNWVSRMPVTRPLWLGDELFAAHQNYFKKVSAKGEELDFVMELDKNFTTLTSGPLLCKDKIMLSEAAYPDGNIFTGKDARVYAANAKLKPIWYAKTEEDINGVGDVVCNDDLIFAVSNTEIAAFTHEGKEAWQFESKGGVFMFGSHRGILLAGNLPVANKVQAGRQAVLAGPYLYVTSRSGRDVFRDKPDDIAVFEAKTGKLLEQIETNTNIIDMAVFGPNLALATSDGLRFIGLKP